MVWRLGFKFIYVVRLVANVYRVYSTIDTTTYIWRELKNFGGADDCDCFPKTWVTWSDDFRKYLQQAGRQAKYQILNCKIEV